MNIEVLRYFIELAHEGSFNKAAKRLFISQQGLNRAISALEAKLGATLIERGPDGVSLTPEGSILLAHANAIVDDYRSMTDEILSYRISKNAASMERLHITITPYLAAVGMDRIWDTASMDIASIRELPLHRILEEAPVSGPDDLFVADLFLKTRRKIREDESIGFEPVFATRIGIIRSKTFPWNKEGPLHCEDVSELPVAYTSDSTNTGLVAYLFKNVPLKNACLQSSSLSTLLEWVHERRTVSLFDSFAFYRLQKLAPAEVDDLLFIPFADEEAVDTVGYLYRSDEPPSDVTRGSIANSRLIFARDSADYLRQYPLPKDF